MVDPKKAAQIRPQVASNALHSQNITHILFCLKEVDAVLYVFLRVTGADPPARHRGAHEPVSGTSLQGARRGRRHPGPSW